MTEPNITSTQNPRIKALATLRRKGPDSDNSPVLIDGPREISRALQAGAMLEELYYCPALMAPDAANLLQNAAARQVPIVSVPEHVFDKIRYGDRTGGLVAVARRPRRDLPDLALSAAPLIAVLDGVGKPGNLGAIVRSADGAGVEAVLVVNSAIDLYGPNVIRASVSAIFRVSVVEAADSDARAFLHTRGAQIVAASPDATRLYTDLDFRPPTAFVFGAEDRGLGDAWRESGVEAVRVPMLGLGDSLNVATTAALLFYEALRQRGGSG